MFWSDCWPQDEYASVVHLIRFKTACIFKHNSEYLTPQLCVHTEANLHVTLIFHLTCLRNATSVGFIHVVSYFLVITILDAIKAGKIHANNACVYNIHLNELYSSGCVRYFGFRNWDA